MGNPSKSPAGAVSDPNDRAAIAADSILGRHLRHAWWVPGTRIATVAWPLSRLPLDVLRSRFGFWHHWWHAHLLDLIVDAAIHRPIDDAPYDPDLADLAKCCEQVSRQDASLGQALTETGFRPIGAGAGQPLGGG